MNIQNKKTLKFYEVSQSDFEKFTPEVKGLYKIISNKDTKETTQTVKNATDEKISNGNKKKETE